MIRSSLIFMFIIIELSYILNNKREAASTLALLESREQELRKDKSGT